MTSVCATAVSEFLHRLDAAVRDGTFRRLVLGKPRRAQDPSLRSVQVRPVALKSGPHLSFVWRHATREVTRNFAPPDGAPEVGRLLGTTFHSAHLYLADRAVQLEFNRKGEARLTAGRLPRNLGESARPGHDRTKERLLDERSRDWLEALGVVNAGGLVREGLADKHRQIHKFVELLSHLVAAAPLPAERPVEVADMGCGKAYLTFAAHDWFTFVAGREARVVGVEQRPDLVEGGNRLAQATGRTKLSFLRGSIAEAPVPAPDILIALHACDTATDDALARGLAAGAALLVVAPCCQQELRPQLRPAADSPLAPALRHGIFAERHAEFATDALRASLLEWAGYDTKVFEFVSTEHTAKNLMIAATRRDAADSPTRRAERAREARALAAFYGIARHALATHLDFPLA